MTWTTPKLLRPEAKADGREAVEAPSGEILVLNRDPELRTFLNRALFSANLSSVSVTAPPEARTRGRATLQPTSRIAPTRGCPSE